MKENKCNGKCYLAKQLKKEAEKEKQESSNIKEKQELVYIHSNPQHHFAPIISIEKTRILISRYCENPKSIPISIFRPPLV